MEKTVFFRIDTFWRRLRNFAFSNRTIFEVIFILIYAIEQILLVFLTLDVKDPLELTLIISLFAIFILTTFALHKTVMDSRIRILENKVNVLSTEKQHLIEEGQELHRRYQQLLAGLEENDAFK